MASMASGWLPSCGTILYLLDFPLGFVWLYDGLMEMETENATNGMLLYMWNEDVLHFSRTFWKAWCWIWMKNEVFGRIRSCGGRVTVYGFDVYFDAVIPVVYCRSLALLCMWRLLFYTENPIDQS